MAWQGELRGEDAGGQRAHLAGGGVPPLPLQLPVEDGVGHVRIHLAYAAVQGVNGRPVVAPDLGPHALGTLGAVLLGLHGALLPEARDVVPPHPGLAALVAQLEHAQLPQILLQMHRARDSGKPIKKAGCKSLRPTQAHAWAVLMRLASMI